MFTATRGMVVGAGLLAAATIPIGAPADGAPPAASAWTTVVNHGDLVPGSVKTFNSYNPPSVNAAGEVVFRARSRGPDRVAGIFRRGRDGVVDTVADITSTVPEPNNTGATFVEFPSFPRIALDSDAVASRWNSAPTVQTPDGAFGHTGVIASIRDGLSARLTQLGNLVGFEQYSVPGATPGTRFEVFPGAPAITGNGTIVFKGNYVDDDAERTGVYYQRSAPGSPIGLIANSNTQIPGAPAGITFGSTAPPSAVGKAAVFTGLDDEAAPTRGGIYLAELRRSPVLVPLVEIGQPVPGVDGATFTHLGEALSFDGRSVGFWGAWGSGTRTLILRCPTEGNQDRIAYCRENFDEYPVQVPAHQGVFRLDLVTGQTQLVAATGAQFEDFLFWTFSGSVPGANGHGGESARWRAAAYVAVGDRAGATSWVAFKARGGDVDGLYLAKLPAGRQLLTVVDTTTPAADLDPEAPAGLVVSSLGLERDGLRGNTLAITASMGSTLDGSEAVWGGVYTADLRGLGRAPGR